MHSVQRISQSVDTSHFTSVNFCVGIENTAGRFAKQMLSKMLSSGKPQKFRCPSLMRCKAWATCRRRPVKRRAMDVNRGQALMSTEWGFLPAYTNAKWSLTFKSLKGNYTTNPQSLFFKTFFWSLMVKVYGQNSNRNTVKQAAEKKK